MNGTLIARWGGVLGWILLAVSLAGGADLVLPTVLSEGTILKSVDGTILQADSNDVWHFEVTEDVNEVDLQLAAGTRFRLLPSMTLGDLLIDANDRVAPRYRLTGQLTEYRETNYLLPGYYLPLSKLKDANEPGGLESLPDLTGTSAGAANEPTGAAMTIPPEILERLRDRRAIRGPQRRAPGGTGVTTTGPRVPNHVLVDAVGFIERHEGRLVFVPDALGRNVSDLRYELLPCRALEQTERRLAAAPERMRLQVAGVVTTYQGKKHLLLQRAIRVYDHGNFGG
jgi:hypothetical protein